VKLTSHLLLVLRLRMVELCLFYSICLHGVVLKSLNTDIYIYIYTERYIYKYHSFGHYPERETSYFYWAHLSRFHLKTET
jgi:hypothetical protein